jgi:apolipoprotein N-acyltransferase
MGFVAFLALLHWLLALSNEEVTIPGLMIPALLLLSLYLALFFGLAALFSSLLARATGLPILLILPPVTCLAEYLRAVGPLAFPWGAPPYALARVTPLIQAADIVGFWGLVFLLLAVNALACSAARGRRAGALGAVGLLAALGAYGAWVLSASPEPGGDPGSRLRVLVAQPNIPREIKWKRDKRPEVIRRVLDHGRAAAERGRASGGFDLFVWPETVLPVQLFNDLPVRARVRAFVDSLGVPLLMGTQEGYWGHEADGTRSWVCHNSSVLLWPHGGTSPLYRKVRLVPFSERMPLQKLLPGLTQIDFGQSNFSPGTGPVLASRGRMQLGCLICFESAFPELASAYVRLGATLLVVLTNDFWFGRSAGPAQHADMAILRAVENRMALVRCANTGISFVVDPFGRVSHETEMHVPADFVAPVALGGGSLAPRHPGWAVRALATALILLVGINVTRKRIARR